MIQVHRLLKALSPHGFQLAWEHWLGRQFNFNYVRPSCVDGVFEHIDIDSMGKQGEAVYCQVWISPLKGHRIHFKPSPEVEEVLIELGNALPDRAYSEFKSPADAIAWEMRVAEIAPQRVRSLAEKHALQVARQTEESRIAAQEYVRRIREISDEPVLEYLEYQLRSSATPAQQQEADRLNRIGASSGDQREAIACAMLAIAIWGLEIDEAHAGFADQSPSRNLELRLRLDITADLLRCQS